MAENLWYPATENYGNVFVPYCGHSEAINLEFETPLSVDEAREILSQAPGVQLVDDWETIFPCL